MLKRSIWCLAVVIIAALIPSGCSSGVPQAQYTALETKYQDAQTQLQGAQTKLQETQQSSQQTAQLVKELSAISAYLLWQDQYYGKNIMTDGAQAFNARLSSLIAATNDANSLAALNVYLKADTAYQQVVAGLPKDNTAWTKAQYDSWVSAGKTRADALGQVGGHLYNVVKAVSWFKAP